jgi:hypothetical protein
MNRPPPVVLVCAALLAALGPCEGASAKDGGPPKAALPVGRWKVEFANGVTEVCAIGNGGESSVEEPRRRCVGMAAVKGGSVAITFGDDRVERWTPVGGRYVVEHWFPASQVPVTAPVLGIAQRAP